MSHGEMDFEGLGEGVVGVSEGAMLFSGRGTKRRWLETTCEETNCSKAPSYGPKGTPPVRCTGHKVDGDVYVKNQCLQMGCTKVSVCTLCMYVVLPVSP